MSALSLPSGLIVPPRPRIALPDARLLIPASSRILRHPLRRWRTRTADDVLTVAASLDADLGTKAQAASTTVSLVTAAPAAAHTLIALKVGYFSATATASVTTTGGLTWFTAGSPTVSGSLHIYIFYAYAAAGLAASTTLTLTASTTTPDWLLDCDSWLGIDSGSPFLAGNGAAASTAAWSTAAIAAGTGNLVLSAAFEDGSGTATSTTTGPASEQHDFNNAGQNEAFTSGYLLSSAGSTTIAGTWSAALSHVCVGAAFLAAAAPSVPANRMKRWRY
jgi:hypothetical protein